ncbi:MAG: indolepyruvate oxidoreductase subunit beta [Acidobacteria bacterium]|nr:indolepyruvate oxidoreductase subunit beta [Acidobacteriota bacterium]
MKYDIVLAGVGGQGVLSVSALIAKSAMKEGLFVKQSEVHGMAQRGGAVSAHLRISDRPVASDLIPYGTASMILSMEPLEALRYLSYLGVNGTVVTSTDPVDNIPDYPRMEQILVAIRSLPHSATIDAERLARESGSVQAINMVLAGAASGLLPIKVETMQESIRELFGRKGEKVVQTNLRAFETGRQAAAC